MCAQVPASYKECKHYYTHILIKTVSLTKEVKDSCIGIYEKTRVTHR